MAKKTILFIFIFILFFLFPTNILALGISPSRLGEYDFQPYLRVEKYVCVLNSVKGYFEVELDLKGNMTEYATLEHERLVLNPKGTTGDKQCTKLILQLPEKLEKPGTHILWVRATQTVSGPEGETMLGGRVSLIIDLMVHVPIPGKYVEADMTIESGEVNEIVTFTISAINRGNQTIESAQGTINIYDQYGNKIAFVKTNTETMEPSVRTEFKAQWLANVEPGEFLANATIDYDGFRTYLSKNFRVGSPTAKILNVSVQPIVNGTIGTITTEVISYWSQNIENAYVTITASKGGYSGTSQSPSSTLKPWEKLKFNNYWDTSDARGPGEYQGIATLHYLNKTDTKEFTLKVIEQPFVFPDYMFIVVMVVIILIIIFIVLVLLTMGRRRKRFKQKKLG